ncbi:Vomeronasal type-1 receptor 3 [Cricetulus griseus]|uniref:Vomeronasal type-1 receptor n=1 Tax=Cricetulus griseus TaxID=10029 RepID=G3I2Q3_CRIGR|nr:Vomeronasal type-1 receptor 3 [Cricetulus griseus]
MIFLYQTIIGSLGNCLLFCYYNFHCFMRRTGRSTYLIVQHLTLANFLVILTKGVPQTMAALGMKDFLSDTGCKLVFYVHRVSRGMCVGSTCFLSVFQAITVSPMVSRWKEVKRHISERMGTAHILTSCWLVNMLLYVIVPMRVTSQQYGMEKMSFGYCGAVSTRITYPLHLILWSSYDVLCLGLMVWSSGFMIFILHRHKHQVQHIRSTNYSLRSCPESRATRGILALVSTFVLSYVLSSVFSLTMALSIGPGVWLVKTSALMAACFSVAAYMPASHRISVLLSACCGRSVYSSRLVR